MLTLPKTHTKHSEKKRNTWPIKAALLTLLLAIGISIVAELLMRNVEVYVAIIVLFIIIIIGILADIIGIASTSSELGPFSAMAAKKIWGAKQAQTLVKNASLVSSVCNDIIGDVCGIISGASGAAIMARAMIAGDRVLGSIILSGIIAALTVGGKALGKKYAVGSSVAILLSAGRILAVFIGDYNQGKRQVK